MNTIELPAWLEEFRPDDGLYADAYEGTPAELRALLKTAVALAFARHGMADGASTASSASRRTGFSVRTASRPAAWLLASAGPGFSSPARLLGELVPAVLAGVPRIIIASEAAFAPDICAAMELAGLEDSFVLPGDRLADLFEDLRAAGPDGRTAFFASADGTFTPAQKDLMHAAALDGIPVRRDAPHPRILIPAEAAPETEALMRRLHPDAILTHAPLPGIRLALAAVPGGAQAAPDADLTAGPGMEACWPGPAPSAFRTETCEAFLFNDEENPS